MRTMNDLSRFLIVAPLLLLPPAMPGQDGMSAPVPGMPLAGVPAATPAATFTPTRVIKMRPDQKRQILIKESERNPYAKRNPQEEVAVQKTVDAEELRIRERIGALRVAGRSRGPNGLRVLLGDLVLEEGRILPQLVEGQIESLRVVELTEEAVVLGWIDPETERPTGKTMEVPYDLSPSVSFALQGQDAGTGEEGVRMGVIRIGPDRKRLKSGMAAHPSGPGIPPEIFEDGQ